MALLQSARKWPFELRHRIFIHPTQYIMQEEELDGQQSQTISILLAPSDAWQKSVVSGRVIVHILLWFRTCRQASVTL